MLRYAVLLGRVLSSRAVKVLLYLWILAWGFDRAIFWATEAAWFNSVGQGAWFGARFWTQFALFWGAFAFALVTAAWTMRIAARPVPGAELRTLTGVLENLEPLRRNATKLAWLALIVGAWILARTLAGGWDVVMIARAGDASDEIYALPLARLILNGLWEWSLFLLGALTFAGGLRALPILAQREPATPLRLWRALGALGALVLLTRAALYVLTASENVWSDGTTGAELFVGWPVAVVGVALCLAAAFWCLKRPGARKLGLAVAAALLGPHLLHIMLAPLSLIVPTPAAVQARNQINTIAAWNLDAPALAANAPPLAAHWPIWNEEALLGLSRGEVPRKAGQIIDWRRATIGAGEAIVAGVPAGIENLGSPHDADAPNGLQWLAYDVTRNVDGRAPTVPDAQLPLSSFYGLGGRALLGDAALDAGVPFEFWGWKFAWAWRLRDPLLMLEGARANRLLVFRGALESAERLAPFLTWDEAQLNMTANGPRWEMVGYAATPFYCGALAASEGAFAGQNAATPVAILRINPRDGRVEFAALPGARWGAPSSQILGVNAVGKSPMPNVEMPSLESARALIARRLGRKNALNEAAWTWTNGRAARVQYASDLPVGASERLAALDAAALGDFPAKENAKLQKGDALLWPDSRAPGGFWVGRAYYSTAATAGVASAGGIAHDDKLWRVGLTGLAPSPISNGDDASAALVAFALQNAPAPVAPTQNGAPVDASALTLRALRALQAHDAAQKAAASSKWAEWAKQSKLERKLLEQVAAELAARRE